MVFTICFLSAQILVVMSAQSAPLNLRDSILETWKTYNRATVFQVEHLTAEAKLGRTGRAVVIRYLQSPKGNYYV